MREPKWGCKLGTKCRAGPGPYPTKCELVTPCESGTTCPGMSSMLKSLRALSDPTRLRIVALLEKDELSVNELQEITRMGQSRISTHLGLLQDAELVQSRREGKRTFYSRNQSADAAAAECMKLATRGAKELPEHGADQINLKRILNRRREQA